MRLDDDQTQDDAYWAAQDYTTRHIDGSPAGKDGCTPEKRCVACMDDKHLAEREGRELKTPAEIMFEIAVSSSASPWPESVKGALPVLAAVQKLMEAAAGGRRYDFQNTVSELEARVSDWYDDLFGQPEKP